MVDNEDTVTVSYEYPSMKDKVEEIGEKTSGLINTLFELGPTVGKSLVDGQLTPKEARAIQEKLDMIKDYLHQIKNVFK